VSGNEQNQLELEIAHLRGLDLQGLHQRWRSEFGRKAPGQLPKYLLMRILAHNCQVEVLGDLSRTTKLFLDELARTKATGGAGVLRTGAVPGHKQLRPGTVLVREHEGHLHHVMVTDDGFVWNGTRYPSLTKIAFAITGTRWNGPRFFGLRESPTDASS
jgi:hypothetical protein